ncbi:alpha-amylase family glycosyl hydrolase [Aquabacterium sp. OR-4]|uniref:alpha-amylase family glycosyl hydrolase n=1 Tax=Aquabacterium sp. OR-4 TaxID=2978127 RepID=UPI0028C516C5|nr:alpha-amylase family glycosyl hydrolase [Aquabacterium sp. OR-4]MDT7834226.1 alpha-amylase family glycosyl hydrolase [Aquabacterium sp. OR-4]
MRTPSRLCRAAAGALALLWVAGAANANAGTSAATSTTTSTTTSTATSTATPPWPDTRPVPARSAERGLKPLPPHWQHGAFMEIFVRAYADSNGDGIGDLRGLIGKLDELQALGIRGIWLMPITASGDHDHGYATTDHRAIEPAYGTLADLDELVRQARQRGIGIIMDYVVNHAAAAHAFFVAARANPASRWRDWFVWADGERPRGWDIWGQDPWYHLASAPWDFNGDPKALPRPDDTARGFYFATFGPHMPDFNLRHPAVLRYHRDSLRFWLNRGLAGFRLDAVPHLIENSAKDWNDQPESRRITKGLQDLIRAYPRRHVVCEATAQPQAWGDPAVCGGAFAFGYTQHFVGAAMGRPESVAELARYYRSARPGMASFVSNHDIFAGQRLWDQVGGGTPGWQARYQLAAAGYLLQPGTPFIYYGEEVGQAGVAELPGDLPLRAPMSWTADTADGRNTGFSTGTPFRPLAPNRATHNLQSQRQQADSLWHFYRAMIGLRNTLPSIARGRFEHSFADGLLLGWQRALGRERTLVLMNYATTPGQARVPGLPRGARLQALWPADAPPAAADGSGQAQVALPAQSLRVYRVIGR